jgi:RNA polymerase primary sigma factor
MKDNTSSQKEIKELITKGKKQGYLTYDEVNDALPDDLMSTEHLDDVVGMFGEMDIEIIDSDRRIQIKEVKSKVGEEDEDNGDDDEAEADAKAVPAGNAYRKNGRPCQALS